MKVYITRPPAYASSPDHVVRVSVDSARKHVGVEMCIVFSPNPSEPLPDDETVQAIATAICLTATVPVMATGTRQMATGGLGASVVFLPAIAPTGEAMTEQAVRARFSMRCL